MNNKYVCLICGYVHDDAKHGQTFESLPDTYVCPECEEGKDAFEIINS